MASMDDGEVENPYRTAMETLLMDQEENWNRQMQRKQHLTMTTYVSKCLASTGPYAHYSMNGMAVGFLRMHMEALLAERNNSE